MKKIQDERLILRNLKNIKVIYTVQTLGILIILAFNLFEGGWNAVRENPLFLLFLISSIVSAYLSINISVDLEKPKGNFRKKYMISMIGWIVISGILGYLVSNESDILTGGMVGLILLICGYIPSTYIYHLRKKAIADLED